MSFVIDPAPEVLQAVSRCSSAVQWFYRTQVVSILAENPYVFREVIQRHVRGDGREFYTYYDGIVPLVFTYRVYPPRDDWQEGAPGYVRIARAEVPWW